MSEDLVEFFCGCSFCTKEKIRRAQGLKYILHQNAYSTEGMELSFRKLKRAEQ